MIYNPTIRLESPHDYHQVEFLVREAFWNVYRPGCLEHYVVRQLRQDLNFVPELDLVLELNEHIIGQIMFVKSAIQTDAGPKIPILTMGPICIAPNYQKKGLGTYLLRYALNKATALKFGAVFMEGNINFYGKSGFVQASLFAIRYGNLTTEEAPFFLGRELIPNYLKQAAGSYAVPPVYLVNEAEAEEFDRSFPAKQKLKLPGQIF
ncbi:MAG: GNAT family N-acetyltransferase [Candidatus Bruticola sp.]